MSRDMHPLLLLLLLPVLLLLLLLVMVVMVVVEGGAGRMPRVKEIRVRDTSNLIICGWHKCRGTCRKSTRLLVVVRT